ncbi:alpha-amylase/4-alpha-glucanotransferase domain-containing protein [uncultured Sphaerochaeta sp.]|uniref:alpha-amylase/4-alpha-glucanotransferase domain-containing protein n=1 Tax=uncultured Sphaerochaeta sp. TaxID=886478 RepID=UPI002A0A780F|nr:alpha-amylase/4-alpha-glucanotransferase domain-containing protein [uncultured Sphaerochaeta sp.]
MKILIGAYSQIASGSPMPVYERALVCVFKPLLTYLYNSSVTVLQLYLNGSIMEWLECNHPEVNMLIADLARKGRVELVSGSYHQSVLSLLSPKDRSNQIELDTTWIRKRYGQRPRTLWCYGELFNPLYINTLNLCCIDKILISSHDTVHNTVCKAIPYQMQELGKTVQIVPTDDLIGNLVKQYGMGEISFKYLLEQARIRLEDVSNEYCIAMVNIDQLCQGNITEEETLALFSLFFDHGASSIEDLFDPNSPLEKGYLQSGWYGYDSLVSDLSCFNEIFVKDESLAYLYGRYTSLWEITRSYKKDKDIRKRIDSLLLKIATGAPYVCDANGSMLRSSVRKLVWRYISEVESVLSSQKDYSYPLNVDYDHDGNMEYLTIGKNLSAVVDAKGGALSELTYLPSLFNYGDTFVPLSGFGSSQALHPLEPGRKQRIFNDVFLDPSLPLDEYKKSDTLHCLDMGKNVYDLSVIDKRNTEFLAIAKCYENGFLSSQLSLEKHYKFRQNTVLLEITITNLGNSEVYCSYGCEIPLSLGMKGTTVPVTLLESKKSNPYEEAEVILDDVKTLRLYDEPNNTSITLVADNRFTLLKEDYTIDYKTTMGQERLYQHTLLLPIWPLAISPGEQKKVTIGLRLERK